MVDKMLEQSWVHDELQLRTPLERGAESFGVQKVQEHLTLNGFATPCDGVFGPATEQRVHEFQEQHNEESSGVVRQMTWQRLTVPMRFALRKTDESLSARNAVVETAAKHLQSDPREIGGPNEGPWVRLYMKGNSGRPWAWCAGFVSFIFQQAYANRPETTPIEYTYSVDDFVSQAKGGAFKKNGKIGAHNPVGSIFVIQGAPNDWVHTGIVRRVDGEVAITIEGNTNDAGHREGVRAQERTRKLDSLDLIFPYQ
jgi:hypothetical protein